MSIWTQKNGEVIDVKDMSREHIKNTLNMLRKSENAFYAGEWIREFEEELKFREYIEKIAKGEL